MNPWDRFPFRSTRRHDLMPIAARNRDFRAGKRRLIRQIDMKRKAVDAEIRGAKSCLKRQRGMEQTPPQSPRQMSGSSHKGDHFVLSAPCSYMELETDRGSTFSARPSVGVVRPLRNTESAAVRRVGRAGDRPPVPLPVRPGSAARVPDSAAQRRIGRPASCRHIYVIQRSVHDG